MQTNQTQNSTEPGSIRSVWMHPISNKIYANIPQGLITLVIKTRLKPEQLTQLYLQMYAKCKQQNLRIDHEACLRIICDAVLIRACLNPIFTADGLQVDEPDEPIPPTTDNNEGGTYALF